MKRIKKSERTPLKGGPVATGKQPGFALPGNAPRAPAHGMPPDELAYRTLLQEAVMWASAQTLLKYDAEVKALALERVKTLRELRGA